MLGADSNLHVVPETVHVLRHSADERDRTVLLERRAASPLRGPAFQEQLLGPGGFLIHLADDAAAQFLFKQRGVPVKLLACEPRVEQLRDAGQELKSRIVSVQLEGRSKLMRPSVSDQTDECVSPLGFEKQTLSPVPEHDT